MSWTVSTSKEKSLLVPFWLEQILAFFFNALGIFVPLCSFPRELDTPSESWTQQDSHRVPGAGGTDPGDSKDRSVHSQLCKQRALLSWIQLCLSQMWLWPFALHHRPRVHFPPNVQQSHQSSPSQPFLNNLLSYLTWIWDSPQVQFYQEKDMRGEEICKNLHYLQNEGKAPAGLIYSHIAPPWTSHVTPTKPAKLVFCRIKHHI